MFVVKFSYVVSYVVPPPHIGLSVVVLVKSNVVGVHFGDEGQVGQLVETVTVLGMQEVELMTVDVTGMQKVVLEELDVVDELEVEEVVEDVEDVLELGECFGELVWLVEVVLDVSRGVVVLVVVVIVTTVTEVGVEVCGRVDMEWIGVVERSVDKV
jgi:hypothetical protein